MFDLQELYQETILDHGRHPRNLGVLEPCSHKARGHNPLCGDKLELYLQVKDGLIEDVKFSGEGCAISTASASMMTEALKGKKVQEANHLLELFHHALTDKKAPSEEEIEELGRLSSLAGVREFPVRVKCATLAWHTYDAAVNKAGVTAKTE